MTHKTNDVHKWKAFAILPKAELTILISYYDDDIQIELKESSKIRVSKYLL
jgi:hypothetical protein